MADYRFTISLDAFDASLLPPGSPPRESAEYSAAVHKFLQEQFAGFKGGARIVVFEQSILVEWTLPSPKHDPIEAAVDRLEKGEVVPAVLMLALLRQQMPNEVRLLYNLGMAYTSLGRLEEARAILNEALRSNPNHINSMVALGVAYAMEARHREAVEVLERAVVADPNNPWAQRNLGGCLLALKELDRATACLLRATELNPKDQEAFYGLGEAYRLAGNLEEADAAYRKVVAINQFGRTAEFAKKQLSSLAHASFVMQGGALGRPDAVTYCLKAIEHFAGLSDKEVERILYEVGMLGTKGFDTNDETKQYELRSMPGKFSGLEMVCIMYVGYRRIAPQVAASFDLSVEYEAAMELAEKRRSRRN
jgi:tetratricopeptide (TPR) repeat protein